MAMGINDNPQPIESQYRRHCLNYERFLSA
jgi:hypothetical protein